MPGVPHSCKTFFGLHLYLAGKYCENPKLPGGQLNLNPAWAITWLVGVPSIVHFAITVHQHLASFYATKYFWKNLATVRKMLIEQNFELRELGPPGRTCRPTPKTASFYDKTIISKEDFQVDCYSLLKHCRRQCTLLPLPVPKFNPKMQDFKRVLDLNCKQKEDWTTHFFQLAF